MDEDETEDTNEKLYFKSEEEINNFLEGLENQINNDNKEYLKEKMMMKS